MEKRLILAIALSILIILIFQSFVQPPKTAVNQPPAYPTRAPAQAPSEALSDVSVSGPLQAPKAKEETQAIETDRYILTFSNIGGSLKTIVLKDYTASGTNEPFALVTNAEGEKGIFSMNSNTLAGALDLEKFTLNQREKNRLVYTYSKPGVFEIVKEYIFPKSLYYIELRISIKNIGSDTIYRHYDLLGGSNFEQADKVMGRRFLEIDSMIDGKTIRNTKVKGDELLLKGIVSWTGVKERYFSIILKPQQDSEGVVLREFGKGNLASGIRSKRIPVYQGTSIQDDYILYVGPNDIKTLKSLGLGLEQIINYGFFGGITKVLLVVLRSFHKVVKNWGVAIIMLTFLINMVLFPLTRKSFHSMRKMQEVQPHIEKLRSLHKDNPQKLNKELAELYRQYNINPFGGCLPLLLQMPIFIALYQGLIRSIELKGANFLWIKDLSTPDSVPLPFTLPVLGNEIHVLPLLMVGAMFLQQMMSTKHTPSMGSEQQKQQRFMLVAFPIFFGFMFYNFPSGLVLYWLTNTVLMIIEHSTMRKT